MAEPLLNLMQEFRCPECHAWFKNASVYGDKFLPQHFNSRGFPCVGSNKSPVLHKRPVRPVGTPRTWDWKDDANCQDVKPSLFDNPFNVEQARAAVQVCKKCPVVEQCWFTAKDDPYYEGIMGGTLWMSEIEEVEPKGKRGRTEAKEITSAEDPHATQTQLSIFGYDEEEDDS